MYFLLTTIFSISFNFDRYIENIGLTLTQNNVVGGLRALSYRGPSPDEFMANGWAHHEGVLVACTLTGHAEDAAQISEQVLSQYDDVSGNMREWVYDFGPSSCVVYDIDKRVMFAIADAAGSVPLWYHVASGTSDQSSHITITSDLFGAFSLDLTTVSPVAAGMILGFDLGQSAEVFFAQHWSSLPAARRSPSRATFQPLTFAYHVLARVYEYTAAVGNHTVLELDRSEPSSRLTSCAVRGLGLHHALYVSEPLVKERHVGDIPLLQKILESVPHYDPTKRKFLEYMGENSVTLRRILMDRFDFISSSLRYSRRSGARPRVLSHQMGSDPSPLTPFKTFVQNYIAALEGVAILYPLGATKVHELVPPGTVNSALTTAMDLLYSTDLVCPRLDNEVIAVGGVLSFRSNENPELLLFGDVSRGVLGDESLVYPVAESAIARLWHAASSHAVPATRDIVVVLATSGYAEMLSNFLCSVKSVRPTNDGAASGVLVITPPFEEGILNTVSLFNVGLYSASLSIELGDCFPAPTDRKESHSHDFGTLCYQKLILMRTTTVMYLLLMGFSPLVADIDVVWQQDALARMHELVSFNNYFDSQDVNKYDLAVTMDHVEICGCFVYLAPSPQGVSFWAEVTDMHTGKVELALKEGLLNFFDSEQKILTEMILKGDVEKRKFRAAILPEPMFPSGQLYFNEWTAADRASNDIVVVHNNFVVGDGVKKMRFKMNGLWSTLDGSCSSGSHDSQGVWGQLFDSAVFDATIPTFTMYMPVHNTVFRNTTQAVIQAGMEGFSVPERYGLVSLSSDPPTVYGFYSFMMYEVSISNANPITSINVALRAQDGNPAMPYSSAALPLYEHGIYSDFTINRPFFAVDRGGLYHDVADKNSELFYNYFEQLDTNATHVVSRDSDVLSETEKSINPCVQITIKVLAYNRPKSLTRLLASLGKADYLGHDGFVDLEILLDGPRYDIQTIEGDTERNLLDMAFQVADEFRWPFGEKRVARRPRNIGLMGQWFRAWSPSGSHEAAFVFEDDIEVSPFFYRYGYVALEKYYCASPEDDAAFQLHAHLDLLRGVRAETELSTGRSVPCSDGINSILSNPSGVLPSMRRGRTPVHGADAAVNSLNAYTKKYSGLPVMYGVCLQNQHLDAMRGSSKLNIRNSNKNFLYSLIGSWGPLFLPLPWQAFLEWWAANCPEILDLAAQNASEKIRSGFVETGLYHDRQRAIHNSIYKKYAPRINVEKLIVNHYWSGNNGIWTPWIVRFSFVTGMKCMYQKFANKGAVLVTNHREAGENYDSSQGSSDTLINSIPFLLQNMRASGRVRFGDLDRFWYFDFAKKVSVPVSVVDTALDEELSSFLSYCNESHDEYIWGSSIEGGVDNSCVKFCSAVLGSVRPSSNFRTQLYESLGRAYQGHSRESELLSSCLKSHLLPISELSRWQYDYNLRRAGAVNSPDTVLAFDESNDVHINTKMCSKNNATAAEDGLSELHWRHVLHMLEGYVSRSAPTLHFGCSYLTYSPVFIGGSSMFFTNSALLTFSGTSVDPAECVRSWKHAGGKYDEECPSVITSARKVAANSEKYGWVNFAELAVVSVSGSINQTIDTSILSLMPRLRYILVLSTNSSVSCEFAPVRLFLKYSRLEFLEVENICSLESDRGGILYKRSSNELSPNKSESTPRSTIRRHAMKLASRTFFWN